MSITYPEWTPAPNREPEPRSGMGAMLEARPGTRDKSLGERMPSIAISIAAHAAIAYVLLFAGMAVMTPKEEQTITVSIAPAVAQPEPQPLPKVVQLPDVRPTVAEIAPPQIEIAAPPAQMAIQAAPPQPPAPQPTEAKPTEDAPFTPPRFDAAYLNNPEPVYPNMSRRLREVGTVLLRVRVSTSGQPLEIQMSKSSGYGRLDEAAQAAVKKWKFQAAQKSGGAVEAWVLVPVEFSLGK